MSLTPTQLTLKIAEAERLGKWDVVVELQKQLTAQLNTLGAL